MFKGDKKQIKHYLEHPKNRLGWIYQQLLKLYAQQVIPGISENVLILDSDVVFFNPVSFQNELGWPLFAQPKAKFEPSYYGHARRLLPNLIKSPHQSSAISHHMLFQRSVLKDLFARVEKHHHCSFWKAFCKCISKDDFYGSGASEYEIYYNFLASRSNQYVVRKLNWGNKLFDDDLSTYQKQGFDYVACHAFMDKRK